MPDALASQPLYPLRFRPILKRLIWGGRKLGDVLGKAIGPESDYAESWELSDHRDDVSVVAEGPLQGFTLRELLRSRGRELLGPSLGPLAQFPLLVKFLDARQVLSVQVHPDDEKGRLLADDNGKTETWVVIHAEPGSRIYAGLKAGVTRSDLAAGLNSGRVEPLLHSFEAKPGDCIMIPAGTVHAIGAGVLLAEIQQMSDATFRVYDWERVGPDGNPRELHIEQALESTDFSAGPVDPMKPLPEPIAAGTVERLSNCQYFMLERYRLQSGVARVGSDQRFTLLLGLEGRARVRHAGLDYSLDYGETLLLPAAIGPCELSAVEPGAVVLSCVVPC